VTKFFSYDHTTKSADIAENITCLTKPNVNNSNYTLKQFYNQPLLLKVNIQPLPKLTELLVDFSCRIK